jgi:hypothetical protein
MSANQNPTMKSAKHKAYQIWTGFVLCFIPFLVVSSISVVPDSPAETFVMISCPPLLILSGVFLVTAIWKTLASFKKSKA